MTLFEEIESHLLADDRPSVHLRALHDRGAFDQPPYDIFPAMAATDQNPKYHPEGDVFTHTLLVVDQAAKRRGESREPRAFMWAALLHDVGKPETTRLRKGRLTAYNHDMAGAKTARAFLEALTGDRDLIDRVAALTRWHMQPFFAGHERARARLGELAAEADYREVALLSLCDRLGRYGVDETEEKRGMETFIRTMEAVTKKERDR